VKGDVIMKVLKKTGIFLTAAAVLLSGGLLGKFDARHEEQMVHAEVLETKTYQESGSEGNPYSYDGEWEWDVTYSYEIVAASQHWDDTLGEVVYDSYARITQVDINLECIQYTTEYREYNAPPAVPASDTASEATTDPMEPASHGITAVSAATPLSGTATYSSPLLTVTVPSELPDTDEGAALLPVKEVTGKITEGSYNSGYTSVAVILPDTITTIDQISCKASDEFTLTVPSSVTEIDNLSINSGYLTLPASVKKISNISIVHGQFNYNGTCEALFAVYPTYRADSTACCTDGTIKSSGSTYEGTCAQWKNICPDALSALTVTCSDGTVNAPLPTDSHYSFSKDMTATYLGNEETDITSLTIPEEIYGYTVTAIEEEALMGYAKLTAVTVPDTVTTIGSHAIGYWKNSDDTYSKMSKTVIYCTEGSAAEAYAIENGFTYHIGVGPTEAPTEESTEPFSDDWYFESDESEVQASTDEERDTELTTQKPTADPSILLGDINDNGVITVSDLIQLQLFMLGKEPLSKAGLAAADMNLDGRLDSFDLAILKWTLLHQ
jgi:hypothetical protein